LDEPFSNLDSDTRRRLVEDTRALLKSAGATALMVTHDQTEAFAIADRIGVMADGWVLQWDTPAGLYTRPADRRVAGFIGDGEWLRSESLGLPPGFDVRLRPGQLRIDPQGPLSARLESVTFRGPHYAGRLRFASGETATIELDAAVASSIGETVRLGLADAGDLLRFPHPEAARMDGA
jgi:iron(III) transport system ATP-binding protein